MAQNEWLQASRALLGHDASPLHSWCIRPLLYKGSFTHSITMGMPADKFFYLSQNKLLQILLIHVTSQHQPHNSVPSELYSYPYQRVLLTLGVPRALFQIRLYYNTALWPLPSEQRPYFMLPLFLHEFCDQNAGVKSLLALLIEGISISLSHLSKSYPTLQPTGH